MTLIRVDRVHLLRRTLRDPFFADDIRPALGWLDPRRKPWGVKREGGDPTRAYCYDADTLMRTARELARTRSPCARAGAAVMAAPKENELNAMVWCGVKAVRLASDADYQGRFDSGHPQIGSQATL